MIDLLIAGVPLLPPRELVRRAKEEMGSFPLAVALCGQVGAYVMALPRRRYIPAQLHKSLTPVS